MSRRVQRLNHLFREAHSHPAGATPAFRAGRDDRGGSPRAGLDAAGVAGKGTRLVISCRLSVVSGSLPIVSGVLNVNKPAGPTSFDIVRLVRKGTGAKK